MDITKEVGWYARIYYELADLKKKLKNIFREVTMYPRIQLK